MKYFAVTVALGLVIALVVAMSLSIPNVEAAGGAAPSGERAPDLTGFHASEGGREGERQPFKRHKLHPRSGIEDLHKRLGLVRGPRLGQRLTGLIRESLVVAYGDAADPELLDKLAESSLREDRKRYLEKMYSIALLWSELEALENGSYILYDGPRRYAFYLRCVRRFPEFTFALVGRDDDGREIILAVSSPKGSVVEEAAAALLKGAQ